MPNTNIPINSFKKGNQYHKLVTHTGRPKRYVTPEDLWKSATGYFEWCTTTPVITYRPRRGALVPVFKNREMSLKELHAWLGVSNLYYYKKLPAFTRIVNRIHTVVDCYNYVQAAAGFIKGRSVGHIVRKNNRKREMEQKRKAELRSLTIDHDVTSPAHMVGAGVRPHVTPIKNAIAPLGDPLKKAYVDTRKVRIITHITTPLEISIAIGKVRRQTNSIQKTPVDTRKVRIIPYIISPAPLEIPIAIGRARPYIGRHSGNRIPSSVFTRSHRLNLAPT